MIPLALVLQTTADDGLTWPEAMIAISGMILVISIVVVLIWQLASSYRARMSIMREEAYRKLVDENVFLQKQIVEQQKLVAQDVGEVKERVGSIEALLKEVG